jgi:NADH-quinone oxidoreductase subunit A
VSPYFQDYVTVAAFAALGVVLVLALLGVASIFRPAHPHPTKLLTYECGVDPVGSDWSQSQIRYYIFGLLFVIFDVEAVFIFPWAIRVEDFAGAGLGGFILVEMVIFIVILLLGLVYAIRKGVLRWE